MSHQSITICVSVLAAASLSSCLCFRNAAPSGASPESLDGAVVYLRHAATDDAVESPETLRLDDCATQRNLSPDGLEQARALGRWFREQPVEPEQVLTSPLCRCVETARLAFDTAEADDHLMTFHWSGDDVRAARMAWLRATLARPVAAGRVRVLVSHSDFIRELGLDPPAEGEGIVFQATGPNSFHAVARIVGPPYRLIGEPVPAQAR